MREFIEIRSDPSSYFNLVKEMVIADFKLRYQNSFLGILWSLLQPMMLFGVLLFVFSVFARFQIENYAYHLLIGVVLWNFFSEATTSSINSLIQKSRLIKKIYFPRSAIIISSTTNSFINLLFGIVTLLFFMAFSEINLDTTLFLLLLYIIELFFITLGTSFAVSSLSAKYRDISYIWPVLLRLGFWLTPIAYSVSMIPEKYHFFIFLNPITRVIHYSRDALLLSKVSNLDGLLALFITTIIIVVVGFSIFSSRSLQFPEEL
ncbi:ABC transporter permease [Candidatus Woesebacteria bacterium]|nr:ABC transporter permease [Candidatus Woesebacteria bacterium]